MILKTAKKLELLDDEKKVLVDAVNKNRAEYDKLGKGLMNRLKKLAYNDNYCDLHRKIDIVDKLRKPLLKDMRFLNDIRTIIIEEEITHGLRKK